jgi:hypothetical protein
LCDHNIDNIGDCEQDTELKNWSSDIDTDTDLLTASDSEDSEFNVNLDSSMCNDSNGETVNEIDKEYFIFPITLEKADDVCIRLNSLIKSGQIPKDKIFYKYLDSISYAMIDPSHEYDEQVVEFFNTIKFLGGEKTVNFIRGPMWSGCGSGGVFNPENAKPNLGGPGRTTRLKHSSGYTTSSGIIKPWINSFLKLAIDPSVCVKPLVDTPIVKVIAAAMENDGTALKPSIQFDEKQQVNVGLKMTADIELVKSNPVPKSEFLRENVVTEANVTFLSTTDNCVAMPVGVTYKPKAGKTGGDMKEQFLNEVNIVQTCHCCIKSAASTQHILDNAATTVCKSACQVCIENASLCDDCRAQGQISHIPSLRACQRCLEANVRCVRAVVLVLASDCESGNKKAFELISESKNDGTLPPQFIFICLPDAVHVGKSLKCSFANWMLLLDDERACLSMLHTIRDSDPELKRLLPRDSVLNKDRMDVNCVLHLSKESVLARLRTVNYVVHSVLPDSYKISATNQVGLYPHPVAICYGEHGKLLVLDYVPSKNVTRLLEVRLHVPADVKVVGECQGGAKSIAYCDGIAYVSCSSGIQLFPLTKKPALQLKKLKKVDLISELQTRGLDTQGTVSVVRERLSKHLKNVEKIYGETQSDLTKVQLSRKFEPSCVAKASDSILLCASDADKLIYSITLQMDGVAVKGDVTIFSKYPSSCTEVVSMCLNLNILYLSHKGNPGGITAIAMSTLEETTIVRNGTVECGESAHAASYLDGIVYADTGSLQIKSKTPGEESVVIAGTGKEGNLNGKADKASFAQPMGICVELDKNIFITDAQTGSVKLITSITGIVKFLSHLGLLYKAFSVHMKHQTVPKHTLSQAIKLLEELENYLRTTTEKALSHINDGSGRKSQPSGPHGTISTQTKVSVTMILNGLKHLEELVNEHNPDYIIDLHSCLTVQVENLHAIGHFKDQFPTALQYARNLANTVYESIKRVVVWSAYYYTHSKSYYPVLRQSTPLNAIPKLDHLKAQRQLNRREKELMVEWATTNGKAVRQRSVRQETTMFKAGTLPLNMYRSSDYPKDKVSFDTDTDAVEKEPITSVTSASTTTAHEVIEMGQAGETDVDAQVGDEKDEAEVRVEEVEEDEEEYDTDDSDSDHATVDSDQGDSLDSLTFLRAVTTRSGRTVRVVYRE